MKRIFKLLKDLNAPDCTCKAGAIGTLNDEGDKVWFDDNRFFYFLNQVLFKTDWFQEVKEEKKLLSYKMGELTSLVIPFKENLVKENDFENAAKWRAIERIIRAAYESIPDFKPSGECFDIERFKEIMAKMPIKWVEIKTHDV